MDPRSVPFDDVDEVFRSAYRTAFGLTRDRDHSDDIAQEATARTLASWSRVTTGHGHWASRVATNLVLGEWRKGRRVPPPELLQRRAPDGTAETSIDLVAAINGLPRRQREVVVMRYLSDQSQEDVASALGCSVGAVRQHTSRGLAALRRTLGADYLVTGEP